MIPIGSNISVASRDPDLPSYSVQVVAIDYRLGLVRVRLGSNVGASVNIKDIRWLNGAPVVREDDLVFSWSA